MEVPCTGQMEEKRQISIKIHSFASACVTSSAANKSNEIKKNDQRTGGKFSFHRPFVSAVGSTRPPANQSFCISQAESNDRITAFLLAAYVIKINENQICRFYDDSDAYSPEMLRFHDERMHKPKIAENCIQPKIFRRILYAG